MIVISFGESEHCEVILHFYITSFEYIIVIIVKYIHEF